MDDAGVWIEGKLSRSILRDVRPQPINDTVLQSLADHPLHSALHRVARRLLNPGLAYDLSGEIQSSLKPSYDLFELFVLYRLIKELLEELGEGWIRTSSEPNINAGRELHPLDKTLWRFQGPNDLRIELIYQQSFQRARLPSDHRVFASLSGECRPDFILLLRERETLVSWIILDAKYRSSRPRVDDGLADVHRYRDALRVGGKKAAAAFVIVPRLREENEPYAATGFLEHHGFGVLQLFSVGWLSQVHRSLMSSLCNPS